MKSCDICHEDTTVLHRRGGFNQCDDCTTSWDYYHSLTPEELRQEQASMDAYAVEQNLHPN